MDPRKRWDIKHQSVTKGDSPAPFLIEVLNALPRGRCIDLAAGQGANALFMARAGYSVDAFDWSIEGLRVLRDEASASELSVNLVAADLTFFPLPKNRYDVLLCFRYLERSLWPVMARALRPGGALVMETFTTERLKTKPDFPKEYCLQLGELKRAFPELRIDIYREEPAEETASILAFRPPAKT
jgi:2-polyprenyl-3-methyl-5-hydroxy-6-metoxy-1,4-benzoquinol methylase